MLEPEMTRVIHVNDMSVAPGAVYIGRPHGRRGLAGSVLANPYPLASAPTRAELLAKYRDHLDRNPHLFGALPELRGRPLACWCRRDGESTTERNRCHGDVLVKLLERHSDDELRALAARPSGTQATGSGVPLRRQWLQVKAQHPDALLLFRMGDFYEAFDRDAEIMAETLDVVLCGRDIGGGLRVPMAGFPVRESERLMARLIDAGHVLALCDRTGATENGASDAG